MEESVLEQDSTFAGVEARSQSGASPFAPLGPAVGEAIVRVDGGTSGFSAPAVGGVATLTSPLTAKGDIYTRNATTGVRKAVGAPGTVPVADPAEAVGWKWAAVVPSAADVDFDSIFLLM